MDSADRPVALDFTAHYGAGVMALEGRLTQLYDPAVQREQQRRFLHERGGAGRGAANSAGLDVPGRHGPSDFLDLYLSPPFMAFIYAPFALLPYGSAALAWTAVSALVMLAALRLLWPVVPGLHRFGFWTFALVCTSTQPVLFLLADGQDSALALVLLVGGLRLLIARRDRSAGAVLGLGLFKPQLFVLIPIVLAADRRWRALLAAGCVAIGLLAVSAVVVGPVGTADYASLLASPLYRRDVAAANGWKMISLPALLAAISSADAFQTAALLSAVFAALLVDAVRRAASGPRRVPLLFALSILGSLLVSPHVFLYDGVLILIPAALYLSATPEPRLRAALAGLYLLLWTMPIWARAVRVAWLNAPWGAIGVLVIFLLGRRYAATDSIQPTGADAGFIAHQ